MEKWKKITKNILLAFVLVSIGFALGKNFAEKPAIKEPSQCFDNKLYVAVYYLHSTFRCTTCNSIEKRTQNILDSDFRADIANGLIQWRTDDFQENEALAKKFDVMASCVVVALVKNDEVVYFKRLDDTWTLLDKPAEFDLYIRSNVEEVLKMREESA